MTTTAQNIFNNKKRQVFFSLEVLAATKSDTQTLVLGHIAWHHANHQAFNSSMSAAAKYLCYSVNAVKSAVENLKKQNLLVEEPGANGYSRRLKLNTKSPLCFQLLQAFVQMVNKQQTKSALKLYPVQLHLFNSNSRHDSRHQHKMLMLKALITSKIEGALRASRNKQKTYQQTISQLAAKLGWAYMTVKSLLATMQEIGIISVAKEFVGKTARFVFGLSVSMQVEKPKQRPPKVPTSAPIERYRDPVPSS